MKPMENLAPNPLHAVGGSAGSGAKKRKPSPRGDDTTSEPAGAASEDSEGCEVNLHRLDLSIAQTLPEWSNLVKEVFKASPTMGDLGRR